MNRQIFEYHPTIGHKFIRNLKTRVGHEAGGYLVKTNNWGFRSDIDFSQAKTEPQKKRILVFGDSFTAGDGVSNKFRFTDLLENSREDLEVYNFGISSTGTDQQYLTYEEFGKDVEADLIVIVVLVENIRRVNAHYRYYYDDKKNEVVYQKPYFELLGDELVLRNTPVRKGPLKMADLDTSEQNKVDKGGRFEPLRKIIKNAGIQPLVQKFLHYQPLPEYNSRTNPEWILMKNVLKKWIISLGTKKALLVPLPLYQYVEETSDPQPYEQRFSEISAEFGIDLFNPLANLQEYSKSARRAFRFQTDIHPTQEGHMAIFKSLENKVNGLI